MCAYYVQLFHRPEFLVSRFTKQQLEEGFWAIRYLDENPSLTTEQNTYALAAAEFQVL
jgi:hypothetical protein